MTQRINQIIALINEVADLLRYTREKEVENVRFISKKDAEEGIQHLISALELLKKEDGFKIDEVIKRLEEVIAKQNKPNYGDWFKKQNEIAKWPTPQPIQLPFIQEQNDWWNQGAKAGHPSLLDEETNSMVRQRNALAAMAGLL